ncbi:MAG: trehalose operon repressor [Lactobacillales bacterium]|jgi:GntR family trehalose operon transcriptional repressor|nr:trehalose operon repressor [Lactobacillales bacterium]
MATRYQEVFQDIESKIRCGEYAPNTVLPSESEFREIYHVSRDTVRRALALLAENGYIQKKHGKGSIVIGMISPVNFPISGLTSYKELEEIQGFKSETKMVSLSRYTLDEKEAHLIAFPVGAEVWKLVRQRLIDGQAVVLDIDYLLCEFVPNLTKEIAEDSIYAYFEEELNLAISYAKKEITVSDTTEMDKRYLDLRSKDNSVVSVKSHVFLEDTSMFQYTESRHRVDKFQFVEFARRRRTL